MREKLFSRWGRIIVDAIVGRISFTAKKNCMWEGDERRRCCRRSPCHCRLRKDYVGRNGGENSFVLGLEERQLDCIFLNCIEITLRGMQCSVFRLISSYPLESLCCFVYFTPLLSTLKRATWDVLASCQHFATLRLFSAK